MIASTAEQVGRPPAREGAVSATTRARRSGQADAFWTPVSDAAVRIVGAGSYLPHSTVTAGDIARAFPGWTAEQIIEKTGIVERRFLWQLDIEQGRAAPASRDAKEQLTTGVDMGEAALKSALEMASLGPQDLDLLILVTCTPDQPRFSHDAMELQRRLDMRKNVHCFVIDSGCGGTLYALDLVARMLDAGAARTAAIVGTHFTSAMIDRSVYGRDGQLGQDGKVISPYFSTYVFGDGAGALVVCAERGGKLGVRASIAGNDTRDLVRSPGGGTESPPYGDRYRAVDHAFVINGRLVASSYLETMASCISGVVRHAGAGLGQVERFYLHQPNARVLAALADRLNLREDQVASNVARVGNTSSAGMFMLLADDLHCGRVALGSGAPVVLAAIGAGVQYGAQFVIL